MPSTSDGLPLRLPKSTWASQFVPGPHGSPQSCLVQYAIWVDSQGPEFIQRLRMEVGQRPLLCNCAPGQPCHGEVLVQLLAAPPASSPPADVPTPPCLPQRVKQRRRALSQVSGAAALLASAAAIPPARAVEVRWSQTALHRGFVKLFPDEWTHRVPFPQLEDLLNASPFTDFVEYLETESLEAEAIPGPHSSWGGPGWQAAALGVQAGAVGTKNEVAPLLGFGMQPEDHFLAAVRMATEGLLPFDMDTAAPVDLRFAANRTVHECAQLRRARTRTRGAIRELASRCQGLSCALRKFQPPSVAAVASEVHVALVVAILALIVRWPDWRLAQRFITGFATVGLLERSGVYTEVHCAEPVPLSDMIEQSRGALIAFQSQDMSDEAEFLWNSCLREHEQGWASPILDRSDVVDLFGDDWAAIPSFCHVQPNGKKRRIDDAKRGGQNSAT
eukprot:6462755-Amphidinium_carterae.1